MIAKRLKYFVPLLIFVAVGVFLFRGLTLDPSALPSALIGKPLPPFSLATVADKNRLITQADLTGRVSLINVWATWCISCRVEHPHLVRIAQQFDIPIYGINYKDDNAKALEWLRQFHDPYEFSIADTDGRLGLDLGVYGAPETYVIDRHGVIRHKRVGVVDMNVWQNEIKPIVDQLD